MSRFLWVCLGAALFYAGASMCAASPVVLGYVASGSGVPTERIPLGRFTHLTHAFVTADDAGRAHPDPGVPDRALTKRAHRAGVRVLLAVGGSDSGPSLNRVAQDSVLSAAFIQDVVALARDNGYDGLDVDWEYPEGHADDCVRFVTNLRAALTRWNPRALLTMAVPCTDYYGRWFDGAGLKDQVDWVEVMAYDLHAYPWAHAGHNAPLNPTHSDPVDGLALSFDAFAGYWEGKGFPKSKILMGIPCYGHGFAAQTWGQKPGGPSPHPDIIYNDVLKLDPAQWERRRDAEAGVPYLVKRDGREIISYDDPVSAQAKGRWVREHGLRGVFFWEVSQDLDPATGREPLVQAARVGLGVGR